jgi:predicted DNA-binding transcriptional regulator AlpA
MEWTMLRDYRAGDPALLDRRATCEFFGGSKPINAATLYRGAKLGRYPKPIRVGGSSRWLLEECREALAAMVEGRAVR